MSTFHTWSLSQNPRAGHLGGKVVSMGFIILAFIFGYVIAIFPGGFIAKIVVPFVLVLVLVPFALLVTPSKNVSNRRLLGLIAVWLLFHACTPTYLTVKIASLPDLSPYRLTGWLIVATVCYYWMSSQYFRRLVYQRLSEFNSFFGLLFALVGWIFICSIFGDIPFFSLSIAVKAWGIGLCLLILLAAAIQTKEDIDRILFIAVLCSLFSITIGLIEWGRMDNIFRAFFPTDPERMVGLEWILEDKSRDGVYRVASVFSHPLVFGEYLAMILPFCIYFVTDGKRSAIRYCALLVLCLIPLGIFITHTRSSMVAAVVGIIAFFVARSIALSQKNSSRAIAIIAIVVGGCILTIVLFWLTQDMFQGRTAAERGSSAARITMLSRGLTAIEESPILGYGAGTAASKIGYLSASRSLTIDNYYLSIAIENGVPGLIFYLGALFIALRQLFRTNNPQNAGLTAALFASLVVYALIRSILSLTHNQDFSLVVIALLLLANRLPEKGTLVSQLTPVSAFLDDKVEEIHTHKFSNEIPL